MVMVVSGANMLPLIQTEFICGRDHTQVVADIEKQIIGPTNLPVRQNVTGMAQELLVIMFSNHYSN